MNFERKAYNTLLQGIQNYVKDLVNKNCDKTYTGIVTQITEDGYTVLVNGVSYPNLDTIGGTCGINETVKVLVPQGNFNNMFILKAGDITTSNNRYYITTETLNAVNNNDTETSNIDFSNYFS